MVSFQWVPPSALSEGVFIAVGHSSTHGQFPTKHWGGRGGGTILHDPKDTGGEYTPSARDGEQGA